MNTFDYDDVQLIPRRCVVDSRQEVATAVKLGDYEFKIPVVPANMQTVINEPLAVWLASHGYFYVMHRFQPEKRLAFVQKMHQHNLFASISVGVKPDEFKFVEELRAAQATPEFVTIDIAHGHADSVIAMIKFIKKTLPETFVIAGNVGTPEGVHDLETAGADATKVGIGPGRACITKIKTGFGTGGWQLSALEWCATAATKPIIADGGIRTHGDIAKSIRFGATMVMVGSMLAGFEQSPGQIVEHAGKVFKEYFGSASENQKHEHHNIEGKHLLLPLKGDLYQELTDMEEDLQSAISYAGGRELAALRDVDYVLVRNTIYNGDHD
ncbi:GMP reductase [Lapidilactobacillus luobeiensis]|uniref:GMP reductase n=1 Tax=Lapidilactobacillus luobeiensis TaxID=2950371 RepID=UPI0021C3FA9C|nr:GMP reductase [Lapidilactobacillus luobeiensis]